MNRKQWISCMSMTGILLVAWAVEAKAEENVIRILHTNDSHGRAFEGEYDGMGFAKLATLIEENRGEHSLLLDAGDTFHGTTFASLEQGETIVRALNLLKYDALVPGNHDFNYGLERLQELEDSADFPVLGANVLDDAGEPFFESYMIEEINGTSIGIFGLATPETSYKTHPNNVRDVTFEDPSITAQRMVDKLEEEDVDIIIALAHLGIDESSVETSEKVAADVEGIDVIIDGHSHSELENGLEAENGTLIASTGEYVQNLGIVELVVEDGTLTERSARLINRDETEETEPNEEVEQLLTELEESQQEILAEPVGQTAVELIGDREQVRVEETNLGNLIADVLRESTDADIALTNGGGIRASIAAGEITTGDIVEVSPFGNFGVTKEVTGEQLLEILENGVKAYPEPSGGFPQISGFSFQFDEHKEAGNRVHSVVINGEPLNETETYLLATNDFIASGGDEYESLAVLPVANEFSALDELLISYLKEAGEISPETENRIQVGEADEVDSTKPKSEDPVSANYTIQKGDTLFEIGLRSNVQWTTLVEMNSSIENEDLIYAGDMIQLPEHK
ncbi:5'-nucleotidase C-terminal domain-containing protein [Alkalicoccobacillus plakortidis]|uniref:5'-nucleotidase C-terminal domain-containing protein n=1 Tax=Alkalicoccobacillus plakortidis TaxID=444060 RepID=A0ABT0XLZ5_9BACI|nr:5'-nucleotidase C-terminal domain-containing protein [Alkalicoccobacillus plakortidis]MCM2676939.1 5'-nucleotidase C-terminal domain-containing protein [Alkalicoccobacillus plakortidis]